MKMILSILMLVVLCACAPAGSQKIGDLQVSGTWSKATPPNAKVAGGYLTIDNRGRSDDRLLRVESSASQRVEIHEMSDVDGVARMRELVDGLPLPADKVTTLKPGGNHLMFIQPTLPFIEGESVHATLVFEKAGTLEVTFQIQSLTVGSSREAGKHH